MLKCKDIAHMASDYLEGELGWRQNLRVKLHLFICVNCKRFMRHLLSTIGYIRGTKRQAASAEESKRILASLPEQHKTD